MLSFAQPPKANFQHKLRVLRRFVVGSTVVGGIVLLAILALVPVDESVRATGVVQAEEDTIVYAPMDGAIGKLLVYEGARVGKGDPLIELDTTELAQQLRETEAAVARSREALEAEVAAFERTRQLPLPSQFWHVQEELAIVREKTQQTTVELDRATQMQRDGLLSRQDVERAQLALNINRSEEDKAEEKLRLIEGGMEDSVMGELTARVQKARADIRAMEVTRDITRETIQRCTIRATNDGTVTLVVRRRAGQAVARGDDLMHLSHGEKLEADLLAGESEFHRVKPGQRVRMKTQAFNPLKHGYIEGTVQRVATEAKGADNTGGGPELAVVSPRFQVIASIDSSPQPLVIGSSIEASIILRRVPLWRLLLPEPHGG
jgi:HlyD family secretion protein